MKKISGLLLSFAMVLSLASFSFAGDVTKSFTLTRDSKLKGTTLAKGDYTVKFADDKEGELVLLKGKTEVARVKYHFLELKNSPADNAVAYSVADDGSFSIRRLEFKGMKSAIVFE